MIQQTLWCQHGEHEKCHGIVIMPSMRVQICDCNCHVIAEPS